MKNWPNSANGSRSWKGGLKRSRLRSGELRANVPLDDLSIAVLWQQWNEDYPGRQLELSYVLGDVPSDFIFRRLRGRAQLHYGTDLFPEDGIRYSDHRRFGHVWMKIQSLFNLSRRYILSTLDDQILLPIGNEQET